MIILLLEALIDTTLWVRTRNTGTEMHILACDDTVNQSKQGTYKRDDTCKRDRVKEYISTFIAMQVYMYPYMRTYTHAYTHNTYNRQIHK